MKRPNAGRVGHLPARRKVSIYVTSAGVWLTGCIWLVFHYFIKVEDDFGFGDLMSWIGDGSDGWFCRGDDRPSRFIREQQQRVGAFTRGEWVVPGAGCRVRAVGEFGLEGSVVFVPATTAVASIQFIRAQRSTCPEHHRTNRRGDCRRATRGRQRCSPEDRLLPRDANRHRAIVEVPVAGARKILQVGCVRGYRDAPALEIIVAKERCRPSGIDADRRHALSPTRHLTFLPARTRTLRLAQIRDIDVDGLRRTGEISMKVDDDALLGRCWTERLRLGPARGQE